MQNKKCPCLSLALALTLEEHVNLKIKIQTFRVTLSTDVRRSTIQLLAATTISPLRIIYAIKSRTFQQVEVESEEVDMNG